MNKIYTITEKQLKKIEEIQTHSKTLDESLDRWFKEKWVDVSKKKKDGSHPQCGRKDGDGDGKLDGAKPVCRPKKKVSKKTPKTASSYSKKEKKSMTKKKRKNEKKADKKHGKKRGPAYTKYD